MIIDKLADTGNYRDPTSGFWYGPVGGLTNAGVAVNESVAMTLSACWACTRALCAPGGYLPFNLHRKRPGGGSELADDHPIHRLIHDAPNYEMGSTMWRSMGIAQQVNAGNTYAEIERSNGGDILNLWPIHPSRVEVKRDRDTQELYYKVRMDNEQPVELYPWEMFHVPSPMSDDGITGKGVIRNARETIGHAIATETYGGAWFKSGGKLSAVLKHPKRMDKEARENLRKEWKAAYGGPEGDRVGILWEGMEYESIASNPEDSQFIVSRQHNIEEICRWYGVPPHMVEHLLRATFNNIEELGIEFVRYKLLPWLKLWEQEVWRKLLNANEQKTYFAKYNVDALERGDLTKRTAALAQQFFNGALTLNQWMEIEDRNPIGELGDVHFVQSSMITLEDAVNPPEPPAPPQPQATPDQSAPVEPDDDEAATDNSSDSAAVDALRQSYQQHLASVRGATKRAAIGMVNSTVQRMLRKESNEAVRAAKKPDAFIGWVDSFYETHEQSFVSELMEPCYAYELSCLASDEYCPSSDSQLAKALASNHIEKSRNDLLASAECQPEELASRIEALIENWNQTRKEVIL